MSADAGRKLRRRALADVKITRTRYLWADYLPAAELTMLVGKPGIGKSTVAVDLAAKITTGTLAGDFHGTPRPVLYSLTEDAESVFKARFLAAGGNPDLLELVDVVHGDADGSPMLVTADLDGLRATVAELRPALVVLDALNSSITGQHNDNSNVRPQLEDLKGLAHATGAAVLGIGHLRKSAAGVEPLDAIGGAGAYGQVIRQAIACARDEDEGACALSLIKTNLGSLDVASLAYRIEAATVADDEGEDATAGRVDWLGTSEVHVRDLLQRGPQGDEDRSEREEATDWLVGWLAAQGGSAASKDVFAAGKPEGYSKDQLKRAKGKRVCSAKVADRWVWQLVTDATESREQAREQGSSTPDSRSLAPLVLPSRSERLCPECSEPVAAGTVRHPECLRASMRSAS